MLKWFMQFMPEHLGLPATHPTALKDWYVNVLGADLAYADGQPPHASRPSNHRFLIEPPPY